MFCLRSPLSRTAQHFLCALFNSFVVNYLVRLRVATHVTTAIVERLPIPMLGEVPDAMEMVGIGEALVRLKADTTQRTTAFARLNALVADIYQLSEDEFAHVLGTFPLVAIDEREARPARISEAPRLSQVARRLLERARFRLFLRRSVGAREPRAGIGVVDRRVVHVAEPVRLDFDLPAAQLGRAARIVGGLHGFSTAAPTRLPHSVQEPS